MVLLVRCPGCGHDMKYAPNKRHEVKKKVKRCVYCGRSFVVHTNINSTRVVKDLAGFA